MMENLDDILSQEEKMKRILDMLYYNWDRKNNDIVSFTSLDKRIFRDISPWQQVQLLEILANKYDCLTFEHDLLWKSEEDVPDGAVNFYSCGHKDDPFYLEKTRKELSCQRWFEVECKKNFSEVYRRMSRKTGTVFKLHMSNSSRPILYINETPIHKFQNTYSYPYKLMKLALGLPNGSTVPAKDLLRAIRGNRGCSQDLSEIFGSSVIKSVFAREITNSSFRIYCEITEESLNEVSYFKKAPITEKSNTEHFAKMIEECRIFP